MTEETTAKALEKLKRALPDPDDEALTDSLEEAEDEICIFLGVDDFPEKLWLKAVALAECYARRDIALSQAKTSSFTEGRISGSESQYTPEEYGAQADKILDSLKRFRIVKIIKEEPEDEDDT